MPKSQKASQRFSGLLNALEPVRRETVMDTVAKRIETLVRNGDLRKGDRLPPEPELAQMLRVSRSSLREALKGLMFVGLIKARPGDGTYIQGASLSRVMSRHFQWMVVLQEIKYLEIYELRQIIEPRAAALAAQRATRNDIERMERALAEMSESIDRPERFLSYDIELHDALAQASGNVALQTTLRMLYDAMLEARSRVLPLIDDMQLHYERHEKIFHFIRDHRPNLAAKAVLEDLKYAERLIREEMAQDRERALTSKETKPQPAALRGNAAGVRGN
ncbi:MAG TPA: FadR/GntR family transcriptional regulator [Terriglobales bacterium]|nr:FadR/GntR family transcriptional regulator [Terriglobales bacterium]